MGWGGRKETKERDWRGKTNNTEFVSEIIELTKWVVGSVVVSLFKVLYYELQIVREKGTLQWL